MSEQQQGIDNLVFDVSGVIYRTFNALQRAPLNPRSLLQDPDEDDSDRADVLSRMALHSAVNSMQKYFNLFKPKQVVACFDRPNSWRKQYMASELSVSGKLYKGNRRQNQTTAQKLLHEQLIKHVVEFEELLRNETGIIVMAADMLEADDCIAGFVQHHSHQQNIIASNDSDMSQLITAATKVCNLTSGELVTCEDPGFFLFEKIFRGDRTDNILNIMPGVRKTALHKAYADAYTLANMLAEPYTTPAGEETTIQALFEENTLLVDLSKQPPAIRKLIDSTIATSLSRTRSFNFWKFSGYCTKYKLNNIAANLSTYRPLLKGGYQYV